MKVVARAPTTTTFAYPRSNLSMKSCAGRPARLGVADEGDDSRQDRVASAAGDLDDDATLTVDGAGEDFVADRLVDRYGFAGDRSLIYGRRPLQQEAVRGNTLTRPDSNAIAEDDVGGGNLLFARRPE